MDKILRAVTDQILNPLIYILFAIAFLVFIWGIVKFISKGGEEDEVTVAKRHILYGLFGMFIMFSAFALVRLITGVFITGEQSAPTRALIDNIEK